jgi:hypothetical protein
MILFFTPFSIAGCPTPKVEIEDVIPSKAGKALHQICSCADTHTHPLPMHTLNPLHDNINMMEAKIDPTLTGQGSKIGADRQNRLKL